MRSEALLNMTRPSVLRVQLNGSEVGDIFRVEEHVSYRGGLTVQFEGMPREDYAFGDYSSRVWVDERPHRHQVWSWEVEVMKHQQSDQQCDKTATLRPLILPQQNARLLAKDCGSVDCGHVSDPVSQVPLKFVNVITSLSSTTGMLAVDRINPQPPWTDT